MLPRAHPSCQKPSKFPCSHPETHQGAQATGNPSKKMLILAWSKKKIVHFSWHVIFGPWHVTWLWVNSEDRGTFPGAGWSPCASCSSTAPLPMPVPRRAHRCSAPGPSPDRAHRHKGSGLCSRARAGAPRGDGGSVRQQPTLAAPICSLRNFSSGVISTSLAFSIYRQRQTQITRHLLPSSTPDTSRSTAFPTETLLHPTETHTLHPPRLYAG